MKLLIIFSAICVAALAEQDHHANFGNDFNQEYIDTVLRSGEKSPFLLHKPSVHVETSIEDDDDETEAGPFSSKTFISPSEAIEILDQLIGDGNEIDEGFQSGFTPEEVQVPSLVYGAPPPKPVLEYGVPTTTTTTTTTTRRPTTTTTTTTTRRPTTTTTTTTTTPKPVVPEIVYGPPPPPVPVYGVPTTTTTRRPTTTTTTTTTTPRPTTTTTTTTEAPKPVLVYGPPAPPVPVYGVPTTTTTTRRPTTTTTTTTTPRPTTTTTTTTEAPKLIEVYGPPQEEKIIIEKPKSVYGPPPTTEAPKIFEPVVVYGPPEPKVEPVSVYGPPQRVHVTYEAPTTQAPRRIPTGIYGPPERKPTKVYEPPPAPKSTYGAPLPIVREQKQPLVVYGPPVRVYQPSPVYAAPKEVNYGPYPPAGVPQVRNQQQQPQQINYHYTPQTYFIRKIVRNIPKIRISGGSSFPFHIPRLTFF